MKRRAVVNRVDGVQAENRTSVGLYSMHAESTTTSTAKNVGDSAFEFGH